ncbi:hypothetical protein DOTSEDRAFT_91581 [Lecanosticta acicola]|uniref:Tyrosine specific protein phosphatases domain-containing protein n=1 Tax=Lecanosticta acicola TaxID=111012 RepID=A0AAI8YT85_9PEZI|nr:hypothetical protein DOTSEDRAFT_91581 [Lecanosticta acicola]
MAESTTAPPHLQKVLNFRDVGLSINNFSNKNFFKTGLLYRSGIPDDASPGDRLALQQDYKIQTIIDLRTDSEHVEQARKNAKSKPPSASPVAEPRDPAKAWRVPGVKYEYINFNGRAYSNALIKQLSYRNTAKLFGLYLIGYRTQAISVLGENVMAKRGLIGLAEDSLAHCINEVKAIFDVLSNEQNYPLLVHCTQGKDRTGLTVLLVLLLCETPTDAIDRDYMLSETELASEREKRLVEIRAIGLPDEFAGCAKGWVETVSKWIEEEYGGIRRYLQRCGVGQEQQDRVRSILLQA